MLKEILINPIDNFVKEETNKKYIIICDTLRDNFDKYILSLKKKDYCPSYVIKKDGNIHKFFDEKYYSNVTNIEKVNKSSIFIGLENAGKLIQNNNIFTNWCDEVIDNKYVKEVLINDKPEYYNIYTKIQTENLGYLILHLTNKYNLNLKKINLTKQDENSIIFLKQIDIFSYSPNPSLNLEKVNSTIFG